ncbi:hypothetical protein EDD22DRAFT_160790 [Suillus occidentalis]|nr:hypothetical protein EDD22DRAFT_160790 [Suillus occidentalis]
MWRLTTAWVAMEEFSNTLEAIRQHTIVPEFSSHPAFQVIQQFKNLPDFIMFPVFLALRHHDYSITPLTQGHLPPDMEIVHAIKAFSIFANKARAQSRSSSNVLNYACQNWAVHISRAPKPWEQKLAYIFKSFWDRYLLNWLERQWFVYTVYNDFLLDSQADLYLQEHLLQTPGHFNDRSGAVEFSEGEKPAKEHLLQNPNHLNNQSEAVVCSESGKHAKEHLLLTPGHFSNQSEAVVFSEGEKPAKESLLQTPDHLNDQSEVVGFMQHVVLSCITFFRMFKC